MQLISELVGKAKNIFNKGGGQQQVPVLGIDFSHHYVRIAQLDKQDDSWILTNFASRAIDSAIVDPESLQMEVVRILTQLVKEYKFSTNKCAVSLPITSAIIKVIRIPLLKDIELKQAVDNGSLWESSIQLPSELSEYSVFWQVVKRDENKNEMSILFVASKKSEIDATVDLLARAGLDALVVDVRCFALRNILRTRGDLPPNHLSAFLEISGDENYLVFVDGDLPFIYDIFMSEEDAKLIRQGQFDSLDYVFTRLSDQIRAAIQSFIAQSGRTNIELIEFASSLSNAQVILSKIKEVMPDYKIDFLNPLAKVEVPENLKSRIESDKNASGRAVSVGLASRRLDIFGYFKFVTAVSNINLLPNREDRIQEQKRKAVVSESAKKAGVVLGAVGCFVLVLSLVFGFIFSYADKVALARDQYQQEDTKKIQLEAQYNNLQSFINQRAARNDRLFNLRFLNGLPRGVSVKELRLNYDSPSQLILVSRDPTQFTVAASFLAQHPDVSVAKLESVEVDASSGKRDQQLGKIVMVLK